MIWQSLIAESIAGFMVVFMYLCSTEDKTKFTKNAVLQTIVLACAYYSAMLLGGQNIKFTKLSPVNPAIAFAMTFIYSKSAQWKSSWIFYIFSFVGSFLALLFFRLVYSKTAESLK